jgi:hypothetical protein
MLPEFAWLRSTIVQFRVDRSRIRRARPVVPVGLG